MSRLVFAFVRVLDRECSFVARFLPLRQEVLPQHAGLPAFLLSGGRETKEFRLVRDQQPPSLLPDDDETGEGAEPSATEKTLVGVPAIAAYIGESVRGTRHLIDIGALDGAVFRLPNSRIFRMRPSAYRRLVKRQEAATQRREAARAEA